MMLETAAICAKREQRQKLTRSTDQFCKKNYYFARDALQKRNRLDLILPIT